MLDIMEPVSKRSQADFFSDYSFLQDLSAIKMPSVNIIKIFLCP